jgi:hypothetical protein
LLKQSPGFWATTCSTLAVGTVTMLGSKEAALAANDKALTWFRRSLVDVVNGEPEITKG